MGFKIDFRDVLVVSGLGLVFYGTYLLSPPAAFIVVGGIVLGLTILSFWVPFLVDLRKKRG